MLRKYSKKCMKKEPSSLVFQRIRMYSLGYVKATSIWHANEAPYHGEVGHEQG